ncbi:MAG: hypothetical protein Q4D38_14285, partial [Planctomycetia bacterium]|nr:hypothetical protein [Planctomycetia bacterium]
RLPQLSNQVRKRRPDGEPQTPPRVFPFYGIGQILSRALGKKIFSLVLFHTNIRQKKTSRSANHEREFMKNISDRETAAGQSLHRENIAAELRKKFFFQDFLKIFGAAGSISLSRELF